MRVSRAVAWDVGTSRGNDVWAILCRAALRGVELATKVLGVEAAENCVERAELFVVYGVSSPPLTFAPASARAGAEVDWAKLGELERGWLARETGAARK